MPPCVVKKLLFCPNKISLNILLSEHFIAMQTDHSQLSALLLLVMYFNCNSLFRSIAKLNKCRCKYMNATDDMKYKKNQTVI